MFNTSPISAQLLTKPYHHWVSNTNELYTEHVRYVNHTSRDLWVVGLGGVPALVPMTPRGMHHGGSKEEYTVYSSFIQVRTYNIPLSTIDTLVNALQKTIDARIATEESIKLHQAILNRLPVDPDIDHYLDIILVHAVSQADLSLIFNKGRYVDGMNILLTTNLDDIAYTDHPSVEAVEHEIEKQRDATPAFTLTIEANNKSRHSSPLYVNLFGSVRTVMPRFDTLDSRPDGIYIKVQHAINETLHLTKGVEPVWDIQEYYVTYKEASSHGFFKTIGDAETHGDTALQQEILKQSIRIKNMEQDHAHAMLVKDQQHAASLKHAEENHHLKTVRALEEYTYKDNQKHNDYLRDQLHKEASFELNQQLTVRKDNLQTEMALKQQQLEEQLSYQQHYIKLVRDQEILDHSLQLKEVTLASKLYEDQINHQLNMQQRVDNHDLNKRLTLDNHDLSTLLKRSAHQQNITHRQEIHDISKGSKAKRFVSGASQYLPGTARTIGHILSEAL